MSRTIQLGLLRNKLRILTHCWFEADESTMTVACPHMSVDALLALPDSIQLIAKAHSSIPVTSER